MSLSPGNKSGDSFNFYLHKSIALWEPSLIGNNSSQRKIHNKIITNMNKNNNNNNKNYEISLNF